MTVKLHIGHGKTGTSAIQSFLAINASLLGEFQYSYPMDSGAAAAVDGKITSGNIGALIQLLPNLDPASNYIFSSEILFDSFKNRDALSKQLMAVSGLEVIIFTRDLFEHLVSLWGQYVKRHGGTLPIDEWARNYRYFDGVAGVLDYLQENGIPFQLVNYSKHKRNVEEVFMRLVLGEKAPAFMQQAKTLGMTINRSLTMAEYRLQMLFNKAYGERSSGFISDVLVDSLPNIAPSRPAMTPETVEVARANCAAAIARINAHLPEEEAVSTAYSSFARPTEAIDESQLGWEQLDVLVQSISKTILEREQYIQMLRAIIIEPVEASSLRDMALKYETGQPLSKSEALTLMKLAAKLYKQDANIQAKISEWSR